MLKLALAATLPLLAITAMAQVPAPKKAANSAPAASEAASAPVSAAKKALVARVLKLQQPGIEAMGRTMAEQPAMQVMQQAAQALQRVPAERREALARDIEADVRKYADEAVPIVRDRAVKLAPTTIGPLLEQRFTEDELRQVIALLESPVNRKFQGMAGEMQRVIGEKLVADTRSEIEPRARALQQTVAGRLTPPTAGAGSAPKAGTAPPAVPGK
jgi:hypothetical protein